MEAKSIIFEELPGVYDLKQVRLVDVSNGYGYLVLSYEYHDGKIFRSGAVYRQVDGMVFDQTDREIATSLDDLIAKAWRGEIPI